MADILTGRKPGYLASIDNVPPLIFRFQINPDIMTEKRSFKWEEVNSFGSWKLDSAKSVAAGAGRGTRVGSAADLGVVRRAKQSQEFQRSPRQDPASRGEDGRATHLRD